MYQYPYNEIDQEQECLECERKDKKLADVKYWLESIVEQLYAKENLNQEYFERNLEELCAVVGMDIPLSSLQIQRKKSVKKEMFPTNPVDFDAWIHWNNNYIKKTINQ